MVTGPKHVDRRVRISRQPKQMRGGVAEAGGDVAQHQVGTWSGDVVRDAQRAVAAGDDRGGVTLDVRPEPVPQLEGIAGGDDMQVSAQRLGREIDRAPDAIGARAAGSLVEEDGGTSRAYGSASRISATSASLPVRK